jgi:hypothetical protein
MYKIPTFAESQQYNRPFSSYQLSSFKRETEMLLPRSERKKKKSCNKNSIKNTEMYMALSSVYSTSIACS